MLSRMRQPSKLVAKYRSVHRNFRGRVFLNHFSDSIKYFEMKLTVHISYKNMTAAQHLFQYKCLCQYVSSKLYTTTATIVNVFSTSRHSGQAAQLVLFNPMEPNKCTTRFSALPLLRDDSLLYVCRRPPRPINFNWLD